MKPESNNLMSRLRDALDSVFIRSQGGIYTDPNGRSPVPSDTKGIVKDKMKLRKEKQPYPCGYGPCANISITVRQEDENWITVHCAEHNSVTRWRKIKQV